ncbi:unnamed protein product [Ilex paraguariensis]|uniref:Uncharacterized protein n=1 Tax=Ilex paraguariensis TaxID=185542 RepID=A0ABC8UTE3_9AQUA
MVQFYVDWLLLSILYVIPTTNCDLSTYTGGPNHERSSSPIPLKEDDRRRKDDRRDLDRDSGRSRYGRSGDSDRHFDRQSYRSSHSYNRHDDYNRHDKHADDNEREHSKFSQRYGRNSRGGIHSDYSKCESEHNKSRDDLRDVDKFSVDWFDGSGHRNRDKERKPSSLEYQRYNDKEALFDRARSGRRYSNTEDVKSEERGHHKGDRDSQYEKRDHRRSLGDHKRERSPTYGDSKGYQNDSNSRRDSSRHHLKGASGSDTKELDGQMYAKEEKKKYNDWETNRHHERYKREPGEQFEDRTALTSKDEEFPAKKPKLFGLVGGTNDGKDGNLLLYCVAIFKHIFSRVYFPCYVSSFLIMSIIMHY